MSQRLAGFPEQPADAQVSTLTDTVDAAGTVYQFVFTYRERTASWYVDISAQDGTALLRGRRLSPGWSQNLAQFEGPPGGLVCLGSDEFVRGDLGRTNLRLVYFTADEIAALNTARTDGIDRVTVT